MEKANLCVLMGGTDFQRSSYMEMLEKIGDVSYSDDLEKIKARLNEGRYIVTSDSSFIGTAKQYGAEVVGIMFDHFQSIRLSDFDRICEGLYA